MVNEKMTALADEVRELTGTTSDKGIDDMTSDLNEANAEVAAQTSLIEQLSTALEGKTVVSGEDVSAETSDYTALTVQLEEAINSLPDSPDSIATCSITFITTTKSIGYICTTQLDPSGNMFVQCHGGALENSTITIDNIVIGSAVSFLTYYISPGIRIEGDATLITNDFGGAKSMTVIQAANAIVTVFDDA
jgi:hypothetical protein